MRAWGILLFFLPVLACRSNIGPRPLPTPVVILTTAIATVQVTPVETSVPTRTPLPATEALVTPTVHVGVEPTQTATAAPPGYCPRPPDDYTRVTIRGETIDARTYAMLQAAKAIYPGPGDLLMVTQGSYRYDIESSFGTHGGGGAVDISIRDPQDPSVFLWEETDEMVMALRQSGFAAWYRYPGALGEGSPPHIHAVAVGDRELSAAAADQLTGDHGYFRGMDGLAPPYGPHPDPLGGPIVCEWMRELGYGDLR